MYAPRGFVVNRTIAEKRASWPQAAAVMGRSSETLRADQRVDEIDGQQQRHDAAKDVLGVHGCRCSRRLSQPRTYAQAMPKKTSVATMKMTSSRGWGAPPSAGHSTCRAGAW